LPSDSYPVVSLIGLNKSYNRPILNLEDIGQLVNTQIVDIEGLKPIDPQLRLKGQFVKQINGGKLYELYEEGKLSVENIYETIINQ